MSAIPNIKRIKTILVSQPEPSSSGILPYQNMERKYEVKFTFREFSHSEIYTSRELRKQKVNIASYSSIAFSSKTAIDNFFHLCKELLLTISEDTKYYCSTENIANYLQHHITYRRRRIFFGERHFSELQPNLARHGRKERFLVPCSEQGNPEVTNLMASLKLDFTEVYIMRTVNNDLSDLRDMRFDMLVFFNQQGVNSLFENFPDFVQEDRIIAAYGANTQQIIQDKGLHVDIFAPTPTAPSIATAIELFFGEQTKENGSVQ